MKLQILLFRILVVIACLSTPLLAIQNDNDPPLIYSKVKIFFNNIEDMRELQHSGVAIENFHVKDGYLELIVNNIELDILDNSETSYEIVIDDVIKDYEQNIRLPEAEVIPLQKRMKEKYQIEGFEFGSMGGFYTYDEVTTVLDSMRLQYPDLITVKQSIGTSLEGRDIWMAKISDNPDSTEHEAEIYYQSLIHAREPQSMATVIYYMFYLLENYGHNPLVTYLVDNREMYFVPVFNPDGYVYNELTNPRGGGQWRKNKRNNDGSGVFIPAEDGVDLNRNFGWMWGYDDYGSSPDPSSWGYRGTAAFSEPETQVIRDFCISRNFQLAFLYHSWWNVYFLPWAYIENTHCLDSDLYINLAEELILYNNYDWTISTPAYGTANGDQQDWMYGEQSEKNKIIAFTVEVGGEENGFWPSQDDIYPLAQENLYPNLLLALGKGVIVPDSILFFDNITLNSHFVAPKDTLDIIADIALVDTMNEEISIEAIIENFDKSFSTTIPLTRPLPKMAGPGEYKTYSGFWPVTDAEDNYQVTILGKIENLNLQYLDYGDNFTTIAPITLKAWSHLMVRIFAQGM
jgi:hypothetical protein